VVHAGPGRKLNVSSETIMRHIRNNKDEFLDENKSLSIPKSTDIIYHTISRELENKMSAKSIYMFVKRHHQEICQALGIDLER
jgi:hypothetical protein